ncbi:hypothetical protein MMC29_005002 [Sticta canariensis]|nr:hypothetical protein [Sticta canariensis]
MNTESTIRKKTVIQELPTEAFPAPGVQDSKRSTQVTGSGKEMKAPNDAINERVEAGSGESDIPDPMGHIRKVIESAKTFKAISPGLRKAVFVVDCDLEEYISDKPTNDQSLATYLTVSGTANEAYSTSCADYVSWLGPEIGL